MKRIVVSMLAVGALAVAGQAGAATPKYGATVGPGFTISMASKPTKPGLIKIAVADKSSSHNFHLVGPGINLMTQVQDVGLRTFTLTVRKGTYRFVCDPHAGAMKGSFTIK